MRELNKAVGEKYKQQTIHEYYNQNNTVDINWDITSTIYRLVPVLQHTPLQRYKNEQHPYFHETDISL